MDIPLLGKGSSVITEALGGNVHAICFSKSLSILSSYRVEREESFSEIVLYIDLTNVMV